MNFHVQDMKKGCLRLNFQDIILQTCRLRFADEGITGRKIGFIVEKWYNLY